MPWFCWNKAPRKRVPYQIDFRAPLFRGAFLCPDTFRSKSHNMGEKGGVFVEHYIILARSVTYAQRMQKSLGRAGIRCHVFRPPRDLTDMGCAYAVRIAVSDLPGALTALHRDGLDPVQIFLFQKGLYQEVEA